MPTLNSRRRLALAVLVTLVVAALVMPLAGMSADVPVATVPSDGGPISIAVNPVSGRVYVANYAGQTASVIDGVTDSLLATIPMDPAMQPTFPDCVVVDPLASPPRAYVGNFWTGTVKVIDESSLEVTATLLSGDAHGGGPRALALDPGAATPKLFVADYGTDTCSVFNAVTHALITRITVGDVPRALGIFVSAGRRRVFVANRGDGTVSVIDAAADVVVATVPTGGKPKAIAVDDTTGFAWVTNEASNTVTVIDANDEVTATVSVGARPVGIAVDSAGGRVFVANFDSDDVSVIRTSDFSIEATVAVGTDPWAVAVDTGQRKAFVTNYGSGSVSVIASDLAVATCAVGTKPQSLAINENVYPHRVYVGNYGSNDLTIIEDDGLGLAAPLIQLAYAAGPGPVTVAVDRFDGDQTLDTRAFLTGTATSTRPIASAIAAVLVRIDGGAWSPAQITSGAGTPAVSWRAGGAALAPGPHTVEVLAFDETGAACSTSDMGSGGKSSSRSGSAVYGFEVVEPAYVEETDSRIAYRGAWSTASSSAYSGGAVRIARGTGSEFTVTFDGTAVAWTALTGPGYGIAEVELDGARQDVDLYSATYLARQPVWSKTGLETGAHTLKVRWTGKKRTGATSDYIDLDTIGVVGTLTQAPGYPAYVEETDSRIAYRGAWSTASSSAYSGGAVRIARGTGSEFTVTFDGTAVAWTALTGPGYGIAEVELDGARQDVDLYSATYLARQPVWSKTGLETGAHTLKVRWTGRKRTGATSDYIDLDTIGVVGTLTQAPGYPVRYEQDAPGIAYSGSSWATASAASYSGGSLRVARGAGTAIDVSFVGTSVSWVALTGRGYGRALVSLDGAAPQSVDLYSAAYLPQQPVWSRTGLSPVLHTLRIEWTGVRTAGATGDYVDLDALDIGGLILP